MAEGVGGTVEATGRQTGSSERSSRRNQKRPPQRTASFNDHAGSASPPEVAQCQDLLGRVLSV